MVRLKFNRHGGGKRLEEGRAATPSEPFGYKLGDFLDSCQLHWSRLWGVLFFFLSAEEGFQALIWRRQLFVWQIVLDSYSVSSPSGSGAIAWGTLGLREMFFRCSLVSTILGL